ncbi:hypothetical protein GQX73_g4653 [Xylaria multiplex]|uniref:Uncharacterized protein n=1 Tax=Xylaria multiplex TaxID=323545 RepID=A0A7C8IS52_9PEZI|nr:hypothetical protein GQX73_g4653 [Xylaria multiplex]
MASAVFRLPGVAFITGAGGTGESCILVDELNAVSLQHCNAGIGAAVAKAFARSGCSRFAITDIKSLASTKNTLLDINPKAQVLSQEGDIADESFVNSFMADVGSRFTRLDYAVNCAGVLGESLYCHETPLSAYDRIMDINVKGTWLTSKAALGLMINQEPLEHEGQRGAIVSIASQLGIVARPTAGADNDYETKRCPWLTVIKHPIVPRKRQ